MDPKKLAKLPPLPRAGKKGSKLGRVSTGTSNPAKLPGLHVEPEYEPEPDEVTEQTDLYGMTLGGTEPGRWFETTVKDGSIGGRCGRCGRKRKAENLKLTILPFGRGEVWQCKEGCR